MDCHAKVSPRESGKTRESAGRHRRAVHRTKHHPGEGAAMREAQRLEAELVSNAELRAKVLAGRETKSDSGEIPWGDYQPLGAAPDKFVGESVRAGPESEGGADPRGDWPDPPADEAFQGLAGDIVRAIEPHSEADPVALLVQTLVACGNVMGRGPYFEAEADRHGCNLFMVLVGATAKGRKGTSWGHILRLFRMVDPDWAGTRILSGLSSGEGLIWAVRDPIERQDPIKEHGRVTDYEMVVADPGVKDKRLLAYESELASVLRVMGRDGNNLSALIRQGWDTGNLRTLTKNSPAIATGAHISIVGHITRDELRRYLEGTEAANGFANRFLWLCVRRSKCLPEGGSLDPVTLEPLANRLAQAVVSAKQIGELRRDDEARADWHNVYPELSEGRPGLLGAVTSRAEAQVMRLAAIYALLDSSSVIRRHNLRAALALWEYCEASARFIFGDAVGDPTADEILRTLRVSADGMTRTQISSMFGRHQSSRQIGRALDALRELGLANPSKEGTDGRPSERWYAAAGIAKKAN